MKTIQCSPWHIIGSKAYKNLKNKAGRNVANNSGYLWIRIKGVFFPESLCFLTFSFLFSIINIFKVRRRI